MTLDDLEQPLCALFQNTCAFGDHHENFNEDTHTISGKDVAQSLDSSFSQYKVYADIRGGSLETRRQTIVGQLKRRFSGLSDDSSSAP